MSNKTVLFEKRRSIIEKRLSKFPHVPGKCICVFFNQKKIVSINYIIEGSGWHHRLHSFYSSEFSFESHYDDVWIIDKGPRGAITRIVSYSDYSDVNHCDVSKSTVKIFKISLWLVNFIDKFNPKKK